MLTILAALTLAQSDPIGQIIANQPHIQTAEQAAQAAQQAANDVRKAVREAKK